MASEEFMRNKVARLAASDEGQSLYEGRTCKKNQDHGRLRYTANAHCVMCSREAGMAKYYRDVEANRRKSRDYARSRPEYMLWISARLRAQKKGRDFDIEIGDITIPSLCPVLGTPMESPSIDRFDNDQGYTKGNIRIISRKANFLKSNASTEEVEAILRYMKGETQFPEHPDNDDNEDFLLYFIAVGI